MCNRVSIWLRKNKQNKIIALAGLFIIIGSGLVIAAMLLGLEFKEVMFGLGIGIIAVAWSLEIILINIPPPTIPESIKNEDIIDIKASLIRIEEKIDKKNLGVNVKSISMTDNVNEICIDYQLLSDKLATMGEICNELKDPNKLNAALLIQILKFHKEKQEGERDFAYSNLFLLFAAFSFSLVVVFTAFDKIWGALVLVVVIISLVGFGLFIRHSKKNRLEGR